MKTTDELRGTTVWNENRLTPILAIAGTLLVAVSFFIGWWLGLLGVIGLVLACRSDRGPLYLFGPFLHWELVKMTRRSRTHLWRPLLALLAGLPVMVFSFVTTTSVLPEAQRPSQAAVSTIAAGGFLFIFWALFIITLSLVSTYLTYAIAEDRESKRLDFILVTDLRARELVLGKVLSRLVGVLAYPLAALPIVLFIPLLFGVDPVILLYAFAYAAVTLVSIAGLSTAGSVLAKTKKAGGNIVAMVIVPYMLLTVFLRELQQYPRVWFFPGSPIRVPLFSMGDLIELICAGNPVSLLMAWVRAGFAGDLTVIANDFPAYGAFHWTVGLLAVLYAARILRGASANVGDGDAGPKAEAVTEARLPVFDQAIVWKERYCHHLLAGQRRNREVNKIAFLMLSVVPAVLFLVALAFPQTQFQEYVKIVARYSPLMVVWIAIISMVRFGTDSIAREREKDTLFTLMTTLIEPADVMWQKLIGYLRLMQGTVLWVLILGVPAVVLGVHPWWGLLALLLFQVVMMFVMAAIGMYYSADSPNIETAGRRFAFGIAFFSVVLCVGATLLGILTGGPQSPMKYGIVAVFPPITIFTLGHASYAQPHELPYWALGYFLGLFGYLFLGLRLWWRAVRKFEKACDPATETGPFLDNRGTA